MPTTPIARSSRWTEWAMATGLWPAAACSPRPMAVFSFARKSGSDCDSAMRRPFPVGGRAAPLIRDETSRRSRT